MERVFSEIFYLYIRLLLAILNIKIVCEKKCKKKFINGLNQVRTESVLAILFSRERKIFLANLKTNLKIIKI